MLDAFLRTFIISYYFYKLSRKSHGIEVIYPLEGKYCTMNFVWRILICGNDLSVRTSSLAKTKLLTAAMQPLVFNIC